MSIYKVRVRRDTALRWSTVNPTLDVGEIGFETDTKKIKVGNGSNSWNTLDYVSADAAAHNQAISTITGLQTALDGKADLSHSHSISDVTSLQANLDLKADSVHTHFISDVTNLQTTLNGKADLVHSHIISDTTGLQLALDAKSDLGHGHIPEEIQAPGCSGSVVYNNASGVLGGDCSFYYTEQTKTLAVTSGTVTSSYAISDHFEGNLIGAVQAACKNTSGDTIAKGVPVYIVGTVGSTSVLEVAIARADTSAAMPAVGIVESSLINNATGHVTILGVLKNQDTSSFSVGQTVYVGPTGGLVNTRPTGVNILVQNMGKVGRVNSNNGEIIVTGPGRTNDVPNSLSLESLYDVETSGVASGQALVYNGSYWGYGSAGSAGGGFTTATSAPATGGLTEGYRWLDSETGSEFTLVNDGDGFQWVELPSVSASSGAASSGTGITDGDKGDITVSATGTVWTIDSGVVGTSKLGGDITTAGKALLDDADASAQRTTLGLGTAAVSNTGDFAPYSHNHVIGDITASGTPSSSTFLRGDGYWTAPTIYDSITVSINSTPDVISTGSKGYKTIPYNCEITDWYVTSSATGSIEFDIKRASYANYPVTATIIGSTGESPRLSNAVKNKYETLASWSGLNQGDVIEVIVNSCSILQDVSLCMKTRSI